ncbi:MAG TPA: Asp-tRNA(Asn)/Glu-tRNA(Gln) amidotransferase subunit GatA, partial [Gammaproteobacteria bacterium]|nr:Asp-tRNA(Asn)/Glu-tRNA(Gln) amidotransferase subunit GatA [Gammaproteobacteria bacterium]
MHRKNLTQLKQMLEAGDCSSVELTQHFLDRIHQFDGDLNSFVTVTSAEALSAARQADVLRAEGKAGLLNGLPLAQKDIFNTQGVKTSCGSRMLDNFIAPFDATVIEKFVTAGAVMLGKTNMDEFAMGSSNETSFYGAVSNPWDLDRVPGGSSGGSAAAVASRLAPAATGTDTGGSIRQPASLCGITGLKPTYGRVSRWGMIAFASSLDQAGPMAQCAEDCALLLQAMAGFDTRDSTSMDHPVPDYLSGLNEDLTGLRIGLPKEYFTEGLDPAVEQSIRDALKVYESMGATL